MVKWSILFQKYFWFIRLCLCCCMLSTLERTWNIPNTYFGNLYQKRSEMNIVFFLGGESQNKKHTFSKYVGVRWCRKWQNLGFPECRDMNNIIFFWNDSMSFLYFYSLKYFGDKCGACGSIKSETKFQQSSKKYCNRSGDLN